MNIRDTIERLFWTVVATFLGNLVGGAFFDIDVLQAAGTSAIAAGVNFVLIVARARLAVLPNPGQGLPIAGLRIRPLRPLTAKGHREAGQSAVTILVIIVCVLVILWFLGMAHPR